MTPDFEVLADWLMELGFQTVPGLERPTQLWYPNADAWRFYRPCILVAYRMVEKSSTRPVSTIVVSVELHYPAVGVDRAFDSTDLRGIQEVVVDALEQYAELISPRRGSVVHFRDISMRSNAGVSFPLCKTNPKKTPANPNGYLDMDASALPTSGELSEVTCKACLKKFHKAYPWAGRR